MPGGSGSARGAAKSDQRGRPHHHHLAGSLLCSRARSLEERGRAPGGEGGQRLLPVSPPHTPWGKVEGEKHFPHRGKEAPRSSQKHPPVLSFFDLELGVRSLVVLPGDSLAEVST